MNLNRINPTILADTLNGHSGYVSTALIAEIESKPRHRELYWYLQSLPREELNAVASRCSYRNDNMHQMLDYLGGAGSWTKEGGIDAEQVAPIVFKHMENQSKALRATLADTKVSRTIFKEMDLALQHKVPIPIIGDSRFGKTKAVSVWSAMRPGLSRLITVPPSNREFDFFAAHADALGIEYNDRTPYPRLKRQVEYVIQQSRLFLIYDEAHFLVPINYLKDTPPKRINWVRCEVIDKGIGCAFFATPQSMSQTLERYAATTKYNFEQWLGRLAPPLVLADCCDRSELMAVAKVHFPDFDEDLLELICARAMQSEGYLKSVEFTARYATALAQDRHHKTPTDRDVDDAIGRMMPGKQQTPVAPATPLQKRCTKPSAPAAPDDGRRVEPENFPSRAIGQVADLGRAGTRLDLVPA